MADQGCGRHGLPERDKNSDKQNARIEHDMALERAAIELLSDRTELLKGTSKNSPFSGVVDLESG